MARSSSSSSSTSVPKRIRDNIVGQFKSECRYHPKEGADIQLWVGIDYSITSPAIVIYDPTKNEYVHYFVPQNKKQINLEFTLTPQPNSAAPNSAAPNNAPLAALSEEKKREKAQFVFRAIAHELPDRRKCRITYYKALSRAMTEPIVEHMRERKLEASQVHIGIELYAFKAKDSNTITKLSEAGGILRSRITDLGFSWGEVPINTAKLTMAGEGKGQCSKMDMFRAWRIRLRLPDPSKLLGFRQEVQPSDFQGIDGDENIDELTGMPRNLLHCKKEVPCPLEDLVDCFAMLMCSCPLVEDEYGQPIELDANEKKQTKKRKRSAKSKQGGKAKKVSKANEIIVEC